MKASFKLIVLWSIFILTARLSLRLSDLHAAPTLEGLLRGGDNPDIALGSNVSITYKLEINLNDVDEEKASVLKSIFVRNIYHVAEKDKIELIQMISGENNFNAHSQISLRYIPSFDDYYKKDREFMRRYYQGLLTSITLNRSNELSDFFLQHGSGFKKNRDIKNRNKMALYESYKKYLQLDKNEQNEIESPLKSGDPQKKEELEELLKESFYEATHNVTLERENGQFFWRYNLGTITGRYGSDDGRLKKMNILLTKKNIKAVMDNYVSFDGTYQLPRMITIGSSEDGTEQLFKVSFLRARIIAPKEKGLSKMAQNLQEALDKARDKVKSKLLNSNLNSSDDETKIHPLLLEFVY